MGTLPLVLDEIDKLAAQVKEDHLADPCIPPTVLFVYHDGLLSAGFVSRDPYCDETADEIIATVIRLVTITTGPIDTTALEGVIAELEKPH